MVDKGTATLCAALMICFQLLTHYEPEFFLLHLYQSGIYLILILLAFYMYDRWFYMLGMMVPAVWLLLAYGLGILGGGARQISRLVFAQRPESIPGLLGGIIALLAVALIVMCAVHWKRQISGQNLGLKTLWPCAVITLVYYGILIYWFWHDVPHDPALVG